MERPRDTKVDRIPPPTLRNPTEFASERGTGSLKRPDYIPAIPCCAPSTEPRPSPKVPLRFALPGFKTCFAPMDATNLVTSGRSTFHACPSLAASDQGMQPVANGNNSGNAWRHQFGLRSAPLSIHSWSSDSERFQRSLTRSAAQWTPFIRSWSTQQLRPER